MGNALKFLLRSVFFMIGAILIMNSSCKKDEERTYDNNPTGTGTILYQGETYSLSAALYEDYGGYDGIYYYQLYLFSDGVDIENESGYGNAIAIYFSSYSPPIASGTIPYYSESVDPIPTVEAEVALNYNLSTEEGIRITYFIDGELVVLFDNDSQYLSIQFTFIQQDSATITGQFSGGVFEF